MTFARFRTYIRNELKCIVEEIKTREWIDSSNLKLLYGIIFSFVVERIYVWWAGNTLRTAMDLNRPEQFVLSALIHYPQYLLWAIAGGLFALFALNLLLGLCFSLATQLHQRLTRTDGPGPVADSAEVTHD